MSEHGASTTRKLSHEAVEAALEELSKLDMSPKAEAPLRILLTFKALWRDAPSEDGFKADGTGVRETVQELFTIIPGREHVRGTVSLRATNGKPAWLTNDSWRGSFVNYVGPSRPAKSLFQDDKWANQLRPDAVDQVVEKLGAGPRPARDVLAAIALRDRPLPSELGWPDLVEVARERFGLSPDDFERLTADPALDHVDPFAGPEFDPEKLAPGLIEAGINAAEKVEQKISEMQRPHLEAQVQRVLGALVRHGKDSIVALAGVPGTSKSYVARKAARLFADQGCLRELSLSPAYTYEQFMEGPTFGSGGEVEVLPGAFLELNERAEKDPDKQFVLLLEELTRADLPRVLGELLTYLEYRDEDDQFTTMYRRDRTVRVMPNIAILATYNPTDRSAVNLDDALLRRIEPLPFPPSSELLEEILTENLVHPQVIEQLKGMFEACRAQTKERFEDEMPFGHAYFARVYDEADLHYLWQKLRKMLLRPHAPAHPLYDTVLQHYPWAAGPDVTVVAEGTDAGGAGEGQGPGAPSTSANGSPEHEAGVTATAERPAAVPETPAQGTTSG